MARQRKRLGQRRDGRRGVAWFVALAGLLSGGAFPEVAGADHGVYTVPEDKLGYSACAWPSGRVLTVTEDSAYPFPDQTYLERVDAAIDMWDEVLSTSNRGGGMTRTTTGAADIVLQYRPVEPLNPAAPEDPDQAIAEVYLQRTGETEPSRDIAKCPDRQPSTLVLKAAYVRISPRDDWFTGPDAGTGVWQMCGDPDFQPPNPGACEDSVDFGTTIVHELGHTLALYHPQTLDALDEVPPEQADSASSWAACGEVTGDFDAQATMCDGQTLYDSDGRTLETWDIESVHRLYT